jgi:cation-transporting ATPase E
MGFVGILVLYYISRPMDWKRWLLLITMGLAFAVAVLRFGALFQLTPLDFQSGLVITVFLMLAPSVIWAFERLFELGSQVLGLWTGRRAGGKRRLAKK